MEQTGLIVVVSGFSGAGKGTLIKKLVEEHSDLYTLSVSATTRAPRPHEVDGVHYFFLTDEAFEKLVKEDGLIEYAGYCQHYYGTPRSFVEEKLKEGVDVILEIEIQGALQIKEKYPHALLLFVMPPTVAELKRRLVERATESEEIIKERLLRAKEEAQGIEYYDFILINDDIDETVQHMHRVIRSAHYTPDRNEAFLAGIRAELNEL